VYKLIDKRIAILKDLGQITMPLNGFLYMLSVIEGLMKDDKMKDMIQRFQAAGIIPTEQESCHRLLVAQKIVLLSSF
jgi:hypothetical protein